MNLVWETRQMIEFIDEGFGGPNDFNLRSLESITLGPDGFVYGGHQGGDAIGQRYNLATGVPDARVVSGHDVTGMTFGPDFNGNGSTDLFVATRLGIQVHDVVGKSFAEVNNNAGAVDLGGVTELLWEDVVSDYFGTFPAGTGTGTRYAKGISSGPDMNNDGLDDLYAVFSTTNSENNDSQFIAVLSSADLSVIDTIESELVRRAEEIDVDDNGNIYVTGVSRDTLNVHVGSVDHEADSGDAFFIADADARFVKAAGPLGDVRPDAGQSVHVGKDGRIYVGSRFGVRGDGSGDNAGVGAAMIYDVDDSMAGSGIVEASAIEVLANGNAGADFNLDFAGSQIVGFLPIFESDDTVPPDADFDVDGDVDGTDFLTWQLGVGFSAPVDLHPFGDANRDDSIDGADLSIWQQQYGPGALAASLSAIPEPGALVLMMMALVGSASCRRRSQSE